MGFSPGQVFKEAAEGTSHPGAIAGRGAQTGNAEEAANPQSSPTDVWTHTWDGMKQNTKQGDSQPMMAGAPLVGVSSPFFERAAAQALPTVAKAGLIGRGLGGAAGLVVAGIEAVDSAKGIAKGLNEDFHSSSIGEIGDGVTQQAGDTWNKFKNIFHQGDGPPPKGVLGHFGATVAAMTAAEQTLSTVFSAIPFPAIPAVRVLDLDVGWPHLHAHPPNVPGPGALPSTGPVIPIPYVSGAATVLINGMPAARCGDMGLGIWCGGYFPMFEIFLGSSSVWIEGSRAARVGLLTKHCIFSNPKSIVKGGDTPIGAPFGLLVGSSPNVIIGGFPLPSLTAMALGGIFKGLFKGIGWLAGKAAKTNLFSRAAAMAKNSKLGQKATALADDMGKLRKPGQGNLSLLVDYIRSRRLVNGMLKEGKLVFDEACSDAFKKAIQDDLYKIGSTKVGREVLSDLRGTNHSVTIEPLRSPNVSAADQALGPHVLPGHGSQTPKVGGDSRLRLAPNDPQYYSKNMPSHRVTAHELGHTRDNALGTNAQNAPMPPGFDQPRWTNMDEWNNINNVDNPYGREWGLDPRSGHNDVLPDPPPPSPPSPTNPGFDAADTIPNGRAPGAGDTIPGMGPASDAADTIPNGRAPGAGDTIPGMGPASDAFDAADTIPNGRPPGS